MTFAIPDGADIIASIRAQLTVRWAGPATEGEKLADGRTRARAKREALYAEIRERFAARYARNGKRWSYNGAKSDEIARLAGMGIRMSEKSLRDHCPNPAEPRSKPT